MSQSVLFSYAPFATHFKLGVIRLNHAKTLNALTLEMIHQIKQQLEAWAEDPYVVAIWLEGEGDKGFCAGGNVVYVYRAIVEKQDMGRFAHQYFCEEYQLDEYLHRYKKPVLCWGHGYVMGGGMGLFMAAKYRLVTPSSRLAMPEIKIGLYPDVGATYFLNKLPEHYARFLALTSYQVNATDACELGLGSHYVCDEAYPMIFEHMAAGLLEDNSHEHVEQHIERILHTFTMSDDLPLLRPELVAHDKEVEKWMSGDINNIYQSLKAFQTDNANFAVARETFLKGSPLSACVILAQLNWGKEKALDVVFAQETNLSVQLSLYGDFCEGVRALLVDKDKKPKWHHVSVLDVPRDTVINFVPQD